MIVNLEALRAVVRPYASHAIELPQLLENIWPMMQAADTESSELVESIQDLLALHAARSIDDEALRQQLTKLAFPAAAIVQPTIHIYAAQTPQAPAGGLMGLNPTWSLGRVLEPTPA